MKILAIPRLLAFVSIISAFSATGARLASAAPDAGVLRFVAVGDAPYSMPVDEARFRAFIADTNKLAPDFTVHIGDIKSGGSLCSDEALLHVRDLFGLFARPLVYTPGDNEWTDCSRASNGAYDPMERLEFLRRSFFASNRSFGIESLELAQQSAVPGYEKFVENQRWERGGVVFATLHVVGSNNNNLADSPARVAEFQNRNAANLTWMSQAFERAKEAGSPAVVFFMQADPLFDAKEENRTGFNDLIAAFTRESIAFGRPVLLVHGDTHVLTIDQPLIKYGNENVANFTRLEVVGAPFLQGVLVELDPAASQPFAFRPLSLF